MTGILVEIIELESANETYANWWKDSPDACFYTSPVWLRILDEGFDNIRLMVAVVSDEKGLLAMLPLAHVSSKKYTSLPLSPPINVLYGRDTSKEEEENISMAILAELKLAGKPTELKLDFQHDISETAGIVCSSQYVSTVLTFDEHEKPEKQWSSNVRRNVKKAIKKDTRVALSDDFDLFADFIAKTRRRQGSPFYPKPFIEAIGRAVKNGAPIELAFSYTAKEEPISAILLVRHADTVTYAIGGSCEVPELLNTGGNFHLFSWAINRTHEMGVSNFDFGISPRLNQGLIRFKEQWGGQTREIQFINLNNHTPFARDGLPTRMVSKMLTKCPMGIFQRYSSILFKLAM